MDRVEDESGRLRGPDPADAFAGREAARRPEPAGEVAGGHEAGEVRAQLVVTLAVMPLAIRRAGPVDRPFRLIVPDRAVHPRDLAACRDNSPPDCCLILQTPGMARPGRAVLDPVGLAEHVEAHLPGPGGVPVARLIGEPDAAAIGPGPMPPRWRLGQDRVDAAGHDRQEMAEELPRRLPACLADEPGERGPGRPRPMPAKRQSLPAAV